jgi:hypothetical protein
MRFGAQSYVTLDNFYGVSQTLVLDSGFTAPQLVYRPPVTNSSGLFGGIDCSGAPSGSFNVTAGAITHC